MPFKDDARRLRDILEAIRRIEQFVAGMSFEAYEGDEKTRSAVERQMLILSEAAKSLGPAAEQLCPGHDWKGLRGMAICSGMPITASIIAWCGIPSRQSCRD